MRTFKFSLVLRTLENTDVFITLDENISGICSKRVNILSIFYDVLKSCEEFQWNLLQFFILLCVIGF